MNEFMDALGLSKYTSVKKNKKNVDVTIMPLDKMKKSFSDNLRIVKKKLEAGETVVGQNQLGWWLVSQQITSDAERLNIKDFILEDYLTGLGSVTRGLIPESPVLAENPPEGTCNIASHEHHMKPIITKNREHLVMNLYYITEANLNPVVSESTSHPSSIIPSIRKTNFYILKKVPPFYHKVSWA
jgi:hypothetical protein